MPVLSNAPNFFVLGAPKCGTTSLHHYLSQHPNIFMTKIKEPNFFNGRDEYALGLDRYLRRHFRHADTWKVRGESTPAYLRYHQRVIPRMKRHLRSQHDLRFAILLRDPAKRAWSHYLHARRYGWETETFESALDLEEARVRQGRVELCYFQMGLYSTQILAWLDRFPRESFSILLSDDFHEDTAGTLQRLCGFLGVDSTFSFKTSDRRNSARLPRYPVLARVLHRPGRLQRMIRRAAPPTLRRLATAISERNTAPAAAVLEPETEQWLRLRYQPEVERLERILDRDLSAWRSAV